MHPSRQLKKKDGKFNLLIVSNVFLTIIYYYYFILILSYNFRFYVGKEVLEREDLRTLKDPNWINDKVQFFYWYEYQLQYVDLQRLLYLLTEFIIFCNL